MAVKCRPCNCGCTNISLARLWHGICLACGIYALEGSTSKKRAKELWNESF